VFISSVQPASSPGGNSALEQLSFAFASVNITATDTRGNTTSISCGLNTDGNVGHDAQPHQHQDPERR
jgi:hypothetical protein